MRKFLLLAAIGGCGGTSRPVAPPPRPVALTSPAPEVARVPFTVVPAELGDEGVLAKIRHRVVMRRWDVAQLRRDDRATTITQSDREDWLATVPVIDEVPQEIRIVVESDGVRFAAWVPRSQAAPTVLAPTRMLARDGAAASAGLWIEPGAALVPIGEHGDARDVRVLDDELSIEGSLPRGAIGYVWLAAPGAPTNIKRDSVTSWSGPEHTPAALRIAPHSVVRARPAADGAVLATTRDKELTGDGRGARDGWTEIELVREHVRVRGFVADAAVLGAGPAEEWGTIGIGGYGTSGGARITLPAGTCLYDVAEGEVVGVQLVAKDRRAPMIENGWAQLLVYTPWGYMKMYVKNVGADPAAPVWDKCTR